MMSFRRFKALADSYGADLQRWPAALRGDAQALRDASPAARALLDEARALDTAIAAAGRRREAALWPAGEQDAALARLRDGVAARIAPGPSRPVHARRGPAAMLLGAMTWASRGQSGWLGMAMGAGLAVAAGVLIGAQTVPPPVTVDVLTILQPTPIHFFAD